MLAPLPGTLVDVVTCVVVILAVLVAGFPAGHLVELISKVDSPEFSQC